jgi:hypothetical protein
MSRVRILGLVIVVVFGLSTSASASAFENLVSKPFPQSFTAGQQATHTFEFEGKAFKCSTVTFTGEAKAEKQTELETRAEYGECTSFGSLKWTVAMNGCKYQFHLNGQFDILNCNAGKQVELALANGAGCVLRIGEQTKLKQVTFANVKGKNGRNSVEIKLAVEGIAAESNGRGLFCPKAGAQKLDYNGSSMAEGATGALEVI